VEGLAYDVVVPSQNLHGSIEVCLKEAQCPKISYTDGTRLFLQKNLEARLPAQQRVSLVEGHFSEEDMELYNTRAIHASLVMPIMETRV